ncbi:MAG: hypothetical protein V1873_04855 [Verrucomicrobiota bacterium]
MTQVSLKAIIESCHAMEKMAAELYEGFASAAAESYERAFWHNVAEDERRHMGYWEELRDKAEEGQLRNFFENPSETHAELQVTRSKTAALLETGTETRGVRDCILLAAQLEFFMLNPAFEILFHFLKDKAGGRSPEDDYDAHLHKFEMLLRRHAATYPEYNLLADMLTNMWRHSRSCATQLAHIKALQGMIPICAGCKKIRNDAGFWQQVEAYLGEHTDAEFTHGLCPDCVKKVYSEYEDLKQGRADGEGGHGGKAKS